MTNGVLHLVRSKWAGFIYQIVIKSIHKIQNSVLLQTSGVQLRRKCFTFETSESIPVLTYCSIQKTKGMQFCLPLVFFFPPPSFLVLVLNSKLASYMSNVTLCTTGGATLVLLLTALPRFTHYRDISKLVSQERVPKVFLAYVNIRRWRR